MYTKKELKVGIFIIAYQAAQTLISAYQRIPSPLKRKAKEIYCFDDCSDDNTYYAGLGYKVANKIKNFVLYKNPKNLGYGGNQKKGYRYAIKKNMDVVVMLHGDAQYAPEKMPLLLEPFSSPEWENIGLVMGSRMLGDPLKGKMPLYKYIGNKVLTFLENIVLRSNLSEFHSGYRAYNVHVLKQIPFEKCSNDFHFDTEIIIMLLKAGYKIVEVAIPTYYGPGSKSHVNVFKYGMQCLLSVVDYRLQQIGLKKGSKFNSIRNVRSIYEYKKDPTSSHSRIAHWIWSLKSKNLLDVGCGGGFLLQALENKEEYKVAGIEKDTSWKESNILKLYERVFWTDLEGIAMKDLLKTEQFDAIVCADILEHLHNPTKLLEQLKLFIKKDGYLIASLPNMNYLPILIIRLLFPKFRMSKGPLDKTHKGIYNLEICKKLVENNYLIKHIDVTPPPVSLVFGGLSQTWFIKTLNRLNTLLAKFIPTLFAYQFIFVVKPKAYEI